MPSDNLSNSISTNLSTVSLDDVFKLLESEDEADEVQVDALLAELKEQKRSEAAA